MTSFEKPRVCVVGAGAVGGMIGTRLALAGRARVVALARGATLAALQHHGWRMQTAEGLLQAPARVAADAAALGEQDLVIVAVKGPALTQVAGAIAPLLGSGTVVLPAMNGVPWWFCEGLAGFPAGPLESVDPGGRIAVAIAHGQVLGCVVHASASAPEPGLVQHHAGRRLVVGEPAGGSSTRALAVCALLTHAGFEAEASADVRSDIWFKLWGNLSFNPVSALTGATADRILADPLVRGYCAALMREAADLGALIGCRSAQTVEQRLAVAAGLGAFKTSMLQDAEAGRPLELDAIVTAVHEIGRRLGQPTPNIDVLLGLARLYGQVHGLYPETPA